MKKIVLTTILFLAFTSIISAQGFYDGFETYNEGEQLVIQNPVDWTTWNSTPGSVEDPYIQNLSSNVVHISAFNNLIYEIPNYFYGYWEIQFDVYIPEGGDAYFNTLQEFAGAGSSWGMQVYFGHTNYGEGNIDAGGALAAPFTFEYDTWMTIKVTVDIENDWGEFFLDNILIHDWIWSTGAFGINNLNQIGGSNFFAWDGGYYTNPDYYIDNYTVTFDGAMIYPPQNVEAQIFNDADVHITWLPPEEGEPIGYKIWRNSDSLDYVDPLTLEYDELDLDPGTYEYCVSAVYDEGESVQACAEEISIYIFIPPPPMNLTGSQYIVPWEPVYLTWDAPWLGLWIRWDAGINTGNGIGLTNGGTFSCASHWFPDDLSNYDGFNLTEIEFYANDDPAATYVIKVWTGPDGTNEVVSQDVTNFNVDDWNIVVLNTPHTINAAEDLWFGYEITHEGSTFPAGCDDGPAIQYNGDMISIGGGWESLYVLTSGSLNYNWNLAGYIGLTDSLSGFEHYNIYRKDPCVSYFEVIGTTTETQYSDYVDEIGLLTYYVTAIWNPGGESLPSNECEVDVLPGIDNREMNIPQIYPNPSSDIIIIESESEIISLKVYNPKGQTISEVEINNNNFILDVSQLNPGIYFLQIEFKDDHFKKDHS